MQDIFCLTGQESIVNTFKFTTGSLFFHPAFYCYSISGWYGSSLTHRRGDPLWQNYTGNLSAATAEGMFALTASQRFFLFHQPVDMRKAFDGLSGLVQQEMGKDA